MTDETNEALWNAMNTVGQEVAAYRARLQSDLTRVQQTAVEEQMKASIASHPSRFERFIGREFRGAVSIKEVQDSHIDALSCEAFVVPELTGNIEAVRAHVRAEYGSSQRDLALALSKGQQLELSGRITGVDSRTVTIALASIGPGTTMPAAMKATIPIVGVGVGAFYGLVCGVCIWIPAWILNSFQYRDVGRATAFANGAFWFLAIGGALVGAAVGIWGGYFSEERYDPEGKFDARV